LGVQPQEEAPDSLEAAPDELPLLVRAAKVEN
jgi:hypothetical protein